MGSRAGDAEISTGRKEKRGCRVGERKRRGGGRGRSAEKPKKKMVGAEVCGALVSAKRGERKVESA